MSDYVAGLTSQFEKRLSEGKAVESLVGCWLRSQNNCVIHIDKDNLSGVSPYKGPRVVGNGIEHLTPDIIVAAGQDFIAQAHQHNLFGGNSSPIHFVEVKSKTESVWWGKGNAWRTGIDEVCAVGYQRLIQDTACRIDLYFVHWRDIAVCPRNGSPGNPESGVWRINFESFMHERKPQLGTGNRSQDVYFRDLKDMKKVCTIDELLDAAAAVHQKHLDTKQLADIDCLSGARSKIQWHYRRKDVAK